MPKYILWLFRSQPTRNVNAGAALIFLVGWDRCIEFTKTQTYRKCNVPQNLETKFL